MSWFDTVRRVRPQPGHPMLWRLGQSGFLLKSAERLVCLDLYLSDNPMRTSASIVRPEEIDGADLVIGTHDHPDHIDRDALPALMAKSAGAVLAVPELLRERIADELHLPARRVVGLKDGASMEVAGIRLTGVASAHETLNPDLETGLHPCVGALIEMDGVKIYHCGDSCIYEGLCAKLRGFGTIDAMLLPINGRDGARLRSGIIGNMTFQEAVDLAGQIRPRLAVPTHYDMFQGNLEDPDKFAEYMRAKYPDQRYWIGAIGESVTL